MGFKTRVVMWAGLYSSHVLTVFILINISIRGSITAIEPNPYILYAELVIAFFILVVAPVYMFTDIFRAHDEMEGE